MLGYIDNCYDAKKFNKNCADSQMRTYGIDPGQVQDCFDGSFKRRGDYNSDNRLLKEDAVIAK